MTTYKELKDVALQAEEVFWHAIREEYPKDAVAAMYDPARSTATPRLSELKKSLRAATEALLSHARGE